jgi:hypothetical protein
MKQTATPRWESAVLLDAFSGNHEATRELARNLERELTSKTELVECHAALIQSLTLATEQRDATIAQLQKALFSVRRCPGIHTTDQDTGQTFAHGLDVTLVQFGEPRLDFVNCRGE